jgi:hypothetical protein
MATVKPFKPLIERFRDKKTLRDEKQDITFDLLTVGTPRTQVFVVSPEIALAAEELIRSKTFKMPNISELHFPYEDMAIELPITDEIRKLRNVLAPGTHEVDWIALHIHAKGGFVSCTPYYSYVQGMMEPSLFTFALGMDELPVPKVRVGIPNDFSEYKEFSVLPSRTLTEMMYKRGMPPEKMGDFYAAPQAKTMIREGVVELPLMLFACSVLLNCKTGVSKTVVPAKKPPSGVKFGAKKRSAHSHGSYTMLHLSEIENVAADGSVSKHTDISAHYVRGHFKQRKSGVYWWSSFVRGTGELRKRKAYVVKE